MVVRYRRWLDALLAGITFACAARFLLVDPRAGIFEQPCSGRGALFCALGVELTPLSVFGRNPLMIAFAALLLFGSFYTGRRVLIGKAVEETSGGLRLRTPLRQTTIEWDCLIDCTYAQRTAGLNSHLSLTLDGQNPYSMPNVDPEDAKRFCAAARQRREKSISPRAPSASPRAT